MSQQDLETLAKNETDENGLILGKFKSVEDLAASYKELEGKLGQVTEEDQPQTHGDARDRHLHRRADRRSRVGRGATKLIMWTNFSPICSTSLWQNYESGVALPDSGL